MNEKFIKSLRNPKDRNLEFTRIDNFLIDSSGDKYPILNDIPRFVELDNYSQSFGFQWNKFKKTQFDIEGHFNISENRFYKNTRWKNIDLVGNKILEVGSGAGRFTEVLLRTGAELFSVDYSNAVDANWQSNRDKKDFFIAQASIYELPFEENSFEYVFCYGVIQHTPDVKASFMNLVKFLKVGGKLSIDVYKKNWKSIFLSKYWFRLFTKKMSHNKLLKLIEWYVPKWFPISSLLIRIPFIGKFLCQIIPISNYTLQFPELTKQQLVEWAILDTFDMLSPEYDQPQTLSTLKKWALEANLKITYCGVGDNGYVLNATKVCVE
jgi:2-polyprenyl-3-methyl-5-hydroxy-6-metoxy-1,4-benzoquinol methylase